MFHKSMCGPVVDIPLSIVTSMVQLPTSLFLWDSNLRHRRCNKLALATSLLCFYCLIFALLIYIVL